MNIFFTGCSHINHKNIINYSNRPFDSVQEMNQFLIKNWNNIIQSDDEVYHLGDMFLGPKSEMKNYLDKINGKIFLIRGNHEGIEKVCPERFEWIRDYHKDFFLINQIKQQVIFFHYPIESWDDRHHGSIHVHSHTHGLSNKISRRFDVGVDSVASYLTQKDRDNGSWNSIKNNPKHYRPISLEELAEIFSEDYNVK
jgi:calcineurin-like phosphoesterase family protein